MTAQIILFIPKPNPKLIEAKVIEMGPMIDLEFRADHDWPVLGTSTKNVATWDSLGNPPRDEQTDEDEV